MSRLAKFYRLSGISLLVAGGILGYSGCSGLAAGVRVAQVTVQFTVYQFVRGMIIPHVMILAGVGFVAFGLIMLIRGLTLRKRLSSEE